MELPFLYQTRTILRPVKRSLTGANPALRRLQPRRCLHQAIESSQPTSRPPRKSFFQIKAEETGANNASSTRSTITKEEKQAFNRLLSLAKDQQLRQQFSPSDASPAIDRLNTDPIAILNLFKPTNSNSNDRNRSLIDFICRDRIQHVSTLYNTALKSTEEKGDLALWRILQKHIFPLSEVLKPTAEVSKASMTSAMQFLKINSLTQKYQTEHKATHQSSQPVTTSDDSPTTSNTSTSTTNTSPLSQSPPNPPQKLSVLTLLTTLYPATTLLALRLLTLHHPTSPLTHSLLPHLTHLGPTSYVLACNTHLYNAHLFLRWTVYSSLHEICDILADMARGGVEFDRGTLTLLREIGEEREEDLQEGERSDEMGGEEVMLGRRGRTFWVQPEQIKWWTRVEEWMNVIARRLEERGMGEVVREGSQGTWTVSGRQSTGGGGEVWL